VGAPVVVRNSRGEPVLNLAPTNLRAYNYEASAKPAIDSFGADYPPPPVAMPAAPLSATPPGTFGLPNMPGTARTPTTDALRAGNMDLGALAVWVVRHAHAPKINWSAASQ